MKKMQPLENTINVSAFLSKLWRMVNDPSTDHLISWSSGGNSFVIQNRAQFWYELLPVYYKHNNMSSFVRQLNMYGFHKLSPVDNGSMDIEKDEIQFYHPNFQKNHPELLTNIKRKVTGPKVTSLGSPTQSVGKSADDLAKVLADVKHLRGRQNTVDSQLVAMKQENALLWRELAMLRQKHQKQQQIVNKLIQFLMTLVQPTGSRLSGIGGKRHYPLMLNECPEKSKKLSSIDGPTIHELDNTEHISEELAEELEDTVGSPQPESELTKRAKLLEEVREMDQLLDSPEYVEVDDLLSDTEIGSETLEQIPTGTDLENYENAEQNEDLYLNDEKVFLNPSAQDTLLTNLINGSYNINALNGNRQAKKTGAAEKDGESPDLTVARVEYNRLNSAEELQSHMDSTQSELEQLKDILNGCNSLDANALLGLFNDDVPDYIDVLSNNYENDQNKSDPMVSGSELAPYDPGVIDFGQLFEDTSNPGESQPPSNLVKPEVQSTMNTPQITSNDLPVFPQIGKSDVKLEKK